MAGLSNLVEPMGESSPSPSAQRMRRHRARKRMGKRVLSIEMDDEFVDQLVDWGWIRADQIKDPSILGDVIADALECKKRGVFREGPIAVHGTATGS